MLHSGEIITSHFPLIHTSTENSFTIVFKEAITFYVHFISLYFMPPNSSPLQASYS